MLSGAFRPFRGYRPAFTENHPLDDFPGVAPPTLKTGPRAGFSGYFGPKESFPQTPFQESRKEGTTSLIYHSKMGMYIYNILNIHGGMNQ